MAETKTKDQTAETVASPKQNAKLEHTAGGVHTRDDLHDVGVPMLPGDKSEPVGPEDALGVGPKRGDYTQRVGPESYQPHEAQLIPEDEREPNGPVSRLVAQRPRVEDIGDAKGLKGGVDTA